MNTLRRLVSLLLCAFAVPTLAQIQKVEPHPPAAVTGAYGVPYTSDLESAVMLMWPHGVNARLVITSTVGTGSVTQTGNQQITLKTGASAGGAATLASRRAPRFSPQQSVRVTGSSPDMGCKVGVKKLLGAGTATLGYFFGCDPATGAFGIMYRNATGDHFIPQSQWNGADRFDGAGPSGIALGGNVPNFYVIDYRMGSGYTFFYIELPNKELTLVHSFSWRNTTTASGVSEGNLPLRVEVANTTNTTDVTFRVGPMVAQTSEPTSPLGVDWAYSKKITAGNGVETNVFTVRNNATWNGTGGPRDNNVRLMLKALAFAATGGGANATTYCDLHLNATVTGAVFADLSANDSIVAIDTTGTTLSVVGSVVFGFPVVTNSTAIIDLTPYRFRLNPGETYTVCCEGDGATVDVRGALTWVEEW